MFTIIIRSAIIYLFVILLFRIMGKRQIGQMQPFEFVLTLIIADLATIPMSDSGIPILFGVVPLLTLVVIHYSITTFSRKSKKASQLLNGSPIVIISNQCIHYPLLKSLNMSIEDLSELLRGCGFFHFEEVEYAILETNGSLSVMPKSKYAPLTRGDMKLPEERDRFQDFLISDGKFVLENITQQKLTKGFIINLLKLQKVHNIKQLVFLSRDGLNEYNYQEVGKPMKKIIINKGKK